VFLAFGSRCTVKIVLNLCACLIKALSFSPASACDKHKLGHECLHSSQLVQHFLQHHLIPLLCCRQRDTEIAALRATLSERDSKLQDSRSELAELHVQIKDSEDGLQQAYNQLAEASRDRARVRQQLLQNQAELSGVRHSAMSAILVASESSVGQDTDPTSDHDLD